MCRSIVDIHSATTEIRREKKKKKKKKPQGKNIMSASATQGCHNKNNDDTEEHIDNYTMQNSLQICC